MYLSDGDLQAAIERGELICDPRPNSIDPTSIDLHLGALGTAKVWDIERYRRTCEGQGLAGPELRLGTSRSRAFGDDWLVPIPEFDARKDKAEQPVFLRNGVEVVVQPRGFLLWQTHEKVGTPEEGASLICFVNSKSMKARTGLVVHLTAPTIHTSWKGTVTLEIANLGPFDFVLTPGDAVAQLTVARVQSVPKMTMREAGSVTYGQTEASGSA
ncbi:MAG: hypothetical protein JKY65_19685 [Planctomycetes bacterium]|nr:hypothetical protein [Planctomycetota bacterium]